MNESKPIHNSAHNSFWVLLESRLYVFPFFIWEFYWYSICFQSFLKLIKSLLENLDFLNQLSSYIILVFLKVSICTFLWRSVINTFVCISKVFLKDRNSILFQVNDSHIQADVRIDLLHLMIHFLVFEPRDQIVDEVLFYFSHSMGQLKH